MSVNRISRRTLTKGAAWSAPAVLATSAIPAYAASQPPTTPRDKEILNREYMADFWVGHSSEADFRQAGSAPCAVRAVVTTQYGQDADGEPLQAGFSHGIYSYDKVPTGVNATFTTPLVYYIAVNKGLTPELSPVSAQTWRFDGKVSKSEFPTGRNETNGFSDQLMAVRGADVDVYKFTFTGSMEAPLNLDPRDVNSTLNTWPGSQITVVFTGIPQDPYGDAPAGSCIPFSYSSSYLASIELSNGSRKLYDWAITNSSGARGDGSLLTQLENDGIISRR